MKTPSSDLKNEVPRVKTHCSVYVHYALRPVAALLFIATLAAQLNIIPQPYGFTVVFLALITFGVVKITKPIKIPDDTIENQIKFTKRSLKFKNNDISIIIKVLSLVSVYFFGVLFYNSFFI